MSVSDDALAALDGEWRTALEIHKRLDCWGAISVANELNKAAANGVIERRQTPIHSGFRYEYRKPPHG